MSARCFQGRSGKIKGKIPKQCGEPKRKATRAQRWEVPSVRCFQSSAWNLKNLESNSSLERLRRGCVNSTPHTSHFLVDSHLMTRTCVAQAQVWRAQCTFHIISCVIFMRSCCVFDSPRLLIVPLLAVHFLSHRLLHLPDLQLLLPRCGGQIPCALQLMRAWAPLPSTTLSQVMSPTTTIPYIQESSKRERVFE